MISVCLASFNGEKYIEEQINSILCQLSENDELLISDDGSIDKTLEIIKKNPDSRIKLFYNNFRNVQKNFQFLLQSSKGDIIFLSDQDDVWFSDKIQYYLKCFQENPNATLILADVELIDSSGEVIRRTFYNSGFSKSLFSNLLKNNFLGCSMALRKSLLDIVLPFPSNVPMHDWWIGLCSIVFGEVYFIEEKLMKYRRHESNVTNDSGGNLIDKLVWRLSIVVSLLKRIILKL